MLISLEWVSQYVKIPAGPDALAQRLTLAGLEVERVLSHQLDVEGVMVAEVTGLRPHPNADKLQLAAVTTGNSAVEVVTGARNLSVGDRVPFARVGARLGTRRIAAEEIRGVPSLGMLCSAVELGLGEDADGIFQLDRAAPLGADLRTLYPADTVLDLEIKSNRPDLLSHIGVAREVATLYRVPLRLPAALSQRPTRRSGAVSVSVEDPGGSRRFVARLLTGVRMGASPGWMQARLRAAGVRPINNVVDITNYVMLETGQPMHAFDHRRLAGGRLVVRRARAGERLQCLDGKIRELNEEFMVVADAERAQALAGIIGGLESAVQPDTTEVLLEAATWEPRRIRATSRALGLRTEASLRFEKGLSPGLSLPTVDRAAALLVELAGARESGAADVYPDPLKPVSIDLAAGRLHRLLGVEVKGDEAAGILERLGFAVVRKAQQLSATPPPWRLDCSIPEDLVEEIGRIHGYDRVPSTLPGTRTPVRDVYQANDTDDRVRGVLVGCGFDEVIGQRLLNREATVPLRIPGAPIEMVGIVNPLLENRDALRASLMPGLLQTLDFNIRQDQAQARFFEIGVAFWGAGERGGRPQEPRLLALVAHLASNQPEAARRELGNVQDAIALVRERVGRLPVEFRGAEADGFHPGRTAHVLHEGRPIGLVGEVHPHTMARLDLPGRAIVAEVLLDALIGGGRAVPQVTALPHFPGVRRDLTLIVTERTPAADLVQVMRQLGGYTLREISMQSEYEGPQLPAGARSLSFRLLYQAEDRTLTGEEVQQLHERIVQGLRQEFQVEVRS